MHLTYHMPFLHDILLNSIIIYFLYVMIINYSYQIDIFMHYNSSGKKKEPRLYQQGSGKIKHTRSLLIPIEGIHFFYLTRKPFL